MDQQAIRTVEYDRPQAQGTTCGIGQAWAKVPDMPSAEQKVALKARIRALLDFCGLPFDAACLAFEDVARDVHTASAAQVRAPLRRDTARASRYGAVLDPLRAALGKAR